MYRTLSVLTLVFCLAYSPSYAQFEKSDLRYRFVATVPVPLNPTEFADAYGVGRGLGFGLGLFISPVWDVQLEYEYTFHRYAPSDQTLSTPVRPDLLRSGSVPLSSLEEGTLSQSRFGFGLKYTFSETNDFNTYLRTMGYIALVDRRAFAIEGNRLDDDLSSLLRSRRFTGSGFGLSLGVEVPVSVTASLLIEPSYSVTYPNSRLSSTLQNLNVRLGFLFNAN